MGPDSAVGVVLLAGGRASRLPGKLDLDAWGMPLLQRVYENVRSAGTVYVCANGQLPAALAGCTVIADQTPYAGPAAALASALPHVVESLVFLVAADAPRVSAAVATELGALWEAGIDAVVPVNAAGFLEPLCALYARLPLLSACRAAAAGSGSMVSAVERLRYKRVRLSDERVFDSVNTPADRRRILEQNRN